MFTPASRGGKLAAFQGVNSVRVAELRRSVRAGPLTALLDGADLRYVKFGDIEIVRRIYGAVRDRNWGTIAGELFEYRVEQTADSFLVEYESVHRRDEINFSWRGRIEGLRDGVIRFAFDGEALTSFLRNRIGICVLHPPETCAGAPCCVEHANGSTTRGAFPKLIAPDCPFEEIRAIEHPLPGSSARVRIEFEGDIFEMEDQRNWLDASFKTYSTPLRLPFPVEVGPGERVRQSVTVRLLGTAPAPEARRLVESDGIVVYVDLGVPSQRIPEIGFGIPSHSYPLTEEQAVLLRLLKPRHLRVDLDLGDRGWRETLGRADEEAAAVGTGIEAALLLSGQPGELEALCGAAGELQSRIVRWLVLHRTEKVPSDELIQATIPLLRKAAAGAEVGAGTNANFTELNRQRPAPAGLDFFAYSINPQVHAFDDLSLVETIRTARDTIESASHFSAEGKVVISPVTLKPRFNPDAAGPTVSARAGELPAAVDARQRGTLAAAWALGIIQGASIPNTRAVTFFETTGWRGLIETPQGSPEPLLFGSRPGELFPVYHAFRAVAEMDSLISASSSNPLQVLALAGNAGDGVRVILANLWDSKRVVELRGLEGRHKATVAKLGESKAEPLPVWKLVLGPREIVLVDCS